MTRQEAARIVAVIMHACPSQAARIDRDRANGMVDAYEALLSDLTYEQCNAAVRILLQTKNWMPSVAEIRAAVVELERGPVRPGGEAWGQAKAAIGRYGSYRTSGQDFTFADPIVAKCVAALGWQTLCLSENETADRARFIELYDRFAVQAHREALSPLLGAANEQKRLAREGATSARDAVRNAFALVEANFEQEPS